MGGNFLTSNHECKGLTWKLQGETIKADLMLIPLGRCKMVLGMKWKVRIRGAPQPALKWMEDKYVTPPPKMGCSENMSQRVIHKGAWVVVGWLLGGDVVVKVASKVVSSWWCLLVPSSFDYRDMTLSQLLDFSIYDFYWFFYNVEFVIELFHWNDKDSSDKHFFKFETWKSNVPGVKLSLLYESDDTFLSLQALLDLYYLFGGFMYYLWSRRTLNALSIPRKFSASMFSSLIALVWALRICDGAQATDAALGIRSFLNSTWRTGGRPGRSSGKTFGNSLTTGYKV
nr:hypothetical protein [Tanacetum cinerariifolium]